MKRFFWLLIATLMLFCGCAGTNNSNSNDGQTADGNTSIVTPDDDASGDENQLPSVTLPEQNPTFEPAVTYNVNLPTSTLGTVKTEKTKYSKGDKVRLDVNPNMYHMVKEGSLKVNGTPITNNEFIMGEQDANVTVEFVRENIPEGQIYGANFKGYGHWNMAMINFAKPVSLEGAESVIIEIRFNKSHSGQWIRPVAGTSDGTIYDAFVSGGAKATHNYVIDHDPYFATPDYNWTISDGGSWEATWDGYSSAPTYHIEVPLSSLFVKTNKIDWQPITEFAPLTQDKYLNKLGIHVTNENENDFTIGRTYIRKNGIVIQTTDPANYSTTREDGKDFAFPWKLDNTTSPLTVDLYKPTCEHKQPKLLVLGDSIMTTWWSKSMVRDIANNFNAQLIRDAVGGTTISSIKGTGLVDHAKQGLYKNYVDIYGEFDYIIIERGTNDLWFSAHGVQENFMVGDENSVGLNTTFGSLKYLISHLKEISPNAKIIASTLLYRNDDAGASALVEDYNASLKEVANSYGIYLFDLYNLSGINASNYTTYLSSDNLHPNPEGAKLLTTKWINGLEGIIRR